MIYLKEIGLDGVDYDYVTWDWDKQLVIYLWVIYKAMLFY
jgi:hypothetical protein